MTKQADTDVTDIDLAATLAEVERLTRARQRAQPRGGGRRATPRYSGPGRSGVCRCGHRWDDHHLGIVMNLNYPEPYIPQECEFYGFNETGGLDAAGQPHCGGYVDSMVDQHGGTRR